MTNLNDIKIETCSSSSELVAYLYDELNPSERNAFETHLADCGPCTDEFADLSFARLGVYEWHRDEFASMATPRFVIPYAKAEAKVSWFDSLRGLFVSHGQWATAGGAFALVAIVLGTVFVLSMNKTDEYAANKGQSSDITTVPPTGKDLPTGTTDMATSRENPKIVKISTDGKSPKTASTVNRRTINTPVRRISQPVRAKAPRLNDFDDEDDTTLRLGDLLAEIDTRR